MKSKGNIRSFHLSNTRWLLVLYDFICFSIIEVLLLAFYPSSTQQLKPYEVVIHLFTGGICILSCRFVADIYRQIWRYGGMQTYIKLMLSDMAAGVLYVAVERLLPIQHISFIHQLSIVAINLLGAMGMRIVYQYIYQNTNQQSPFQSFLRRISKLLTGATVKPGTENLSAHKIKIAIVGAGREGALLAEELLNNPRSSYKPCCFIDQNENKIGRQIFGIKVLSSEQATQQKLFELGIQEIVFAIPNLTIERRTELYEHYKGSACKLKVYDCAALRPAKGGQCRMREFDIEELLFRQPIELIDDETRKYYQGKTILITGGGGSIGSELCRQLAKAEPKRLVILDVYENGAYDIQQELRTLYHNRLDLQVEISSVCDRMELDKIFDRYHPDIVFHAAAHKHVPLMEHNCCEAVKNNVFGTLNVVKAAVKFQVEHFIMISTDKAVNPTNVMGATKRMCEMIVQSYSAAGDTIFSATRFGNVLGSAGSVIPLFRRQIREGGPVTLTDKRIIRYFMTIPEASQLVLKSGVLAKNGELFVLDMGKPVKILDLAENMIRLSGYEPEKDIKIIETGLRPGEKLYEELLIKTEEMDRTSSEKLFIERDKPLDCAVIEEKMALLKNAVSSNNDEEVQKTLMIVVPSYHPMIPEVYEKTADMANRVDEVALIG